MKHLDFPDAPLSLSFLRDAKRQLVREGAQQEFRLAVCPSAEQDVRDLPNFVPAEMYGTMRPELDELGSCEGVRILALPEDVFNARGGYRHTLTATTVETVRLELGPFTHRA
jgi:hypothetical protein